MKPAYSVIIPAFNEEDWLPQTLHDLRDAMIEQNLAGEVIVVDNNSNDRTAQVARSNGVRTVFEPVNQISRARNSGARVARGPFLIFLDADTLVSSQLLQTALDHLASGKYCGGGSLVVFDQPLPLLARKTLDLWNWFSLKFKIAAGCFIYCQREGFEAVDGFSEKVFASEEIWFSHRLRAWGEANKKKFGIISSPRVHTSARKLKWFSPLQLTSAALLATFFPFALRFRSSCSLWYTRPDKTLE